MSQTKLPSRLRQSVLAIAIAACSSLACVPVSHAQPAATGIHLPAQELSAALDSLASQTGIRLLYSPEAVKGKRAPAIDGTLRVEEALNRLLADFGLVWSAEDGVYAVKSATSVTTPSLKELAPVTITATRTEHAADEVPASVTVITPKDIQSQRVEKIEDLLKNIEGMDVLSSGGGDAGQILTRGVGGSFAGATTRVLVDGMPMEPAALPPNNSTLEFSDLGEIERIEVVRGPGAVLYGPSAIGGVINVITRRGVPTLGGELEVGGGSHKARSVRAAMSGGSEIIDFRVYASDAESDGYIAQPEPYFWQQQDLAGQDWHRRKYGVALAIRPTPGQELTLGVRTYETEMPWVGGRPNYRWDRNGTYYDLGYFAELGDRGSLRVKYLSATIKDHLTWDGLGVNSDPADFTHYMTRQSNEYGDHLEMQANYRVTPANLVTLGISHSIGEISEGENIAVPADSIAGWDYYSRSDVKAKTRVTGFFAQDELRVSENTLVTIGGRYDRFKLLGNTRYDWDNYGTDERRNDPDSIDGVFNPRLGVRHKVTSATSIYAAYGTAYLPAMSWLRYRSNPACNSPDLNSESSTSYEIGANHDLGGWSTKAAIFHTDYEDKIESQRRATCTQYVNVASATVDGVEIAMEAPRGALWRPYFNYTYNDSRVESNPADTASEGKRLSQIAKHKFNVGMIYSPIDDLTARLSGRFVGDRYFSSSNHPDSRAAGYFLADFKISYRLALNVGIKDAELSFAVNNLFDKKYLLQKGFAAIGDGVETFREYGDGRNFWLGLKAGF